MTQSFLNTPSLAGMVTEGVIGDAPWRTHDAWVPPRVVFRRGMIHWSTKNPRRKSDDGHFTEPRGMLLAFTRIRNEKSAVKFAREYGVVAICEKHSLPAGHNPGSLPGLMGDACFPQGWPDDAREPLERWLYYARRAKAILRLGAALHDNDIGDADDWATLLDYEQGVDRSTAQPPSVDYGRAILALALTQWLSLVRPTTRVTWASGKDVEPRLQLTTGVFGTIGLQLTATVLRIGGVEVCDECRHEFTPKKRRNPKKSKYCEDCGERAAAKNRKRRWRERERQRRMKHEQES